MADPSMRGYSASASVRLADPSDMLHRICGHFAEYGMASVEGRRGQIAIDFGSATLDAGASALTLRARSHDDTGLAYVKLALAEHLLAFSLPDVPNIEWRGDGAAGAPLPYFREMRVAAVRDLTPRMRRLTLSGGNLARFGQGGLHVRLLFPPEGTGDPRWPVMGTDGRPSWPAGVERPIARAYTLRRIDPARGEVDIDFVLHDGGHMPGACFAMQARPGDVVGMTGPGGGSAPEADSYLLAGDETALPAIARIVEGLPATARAVVRIEVADAREEQELRSDATLDMAWLHRNGAAAGTTSLLEDAVRDIGLPETTERHFFWIGCEHRSFVALRKHLRADRSLSREQHHVAAYWRRGFDGDTARSEA